MPELKEVKQILMTPQERDAAYESISEQEWREFAASTSVAIGRLSDDAEYHILGGTRDESADGFDELLKRLPKQAYFFIAPHKQRLTAEVA